ncbi:MAG: NB-ARC domain-containing protein [Candidatus Marithrix sp.]
MDIKKILDRQALQPQYVVDHNEKKTAVIISLVKFNELFDKIATVVQLAESLERTVAQQKKQGSSIEAPTEDITSIKQHYELLNKMLENLREYQTTNVVVKRKLMLQNIITNLEKEVQTRKSLLGEVKKQTKPAVLHNVAKLPTDIIKSSVFNKIKNGLLDKPIGGQKSPVIISAPCGAGKSTIATVLAHDEDVRLTFSDGIFWVNLGVEADILTQQITLIQQFTKSIPDVFSIEEATRYLNKLCETKACLIILDDVWDSQDILAFNIAVEHSRLMVNTSDNNMLGIVQYFINNITNHNLTPFAEQQAIDFFIKHAKQDENTAIPAYLEDLMHACDYLPLTLKLVANVASNIPIEEWSELVERLREVELEFPDKYPLSLMQALHLNIEDLGEPADYYLALGVFADYSNIPQSVVLILWRYLYQLTDEEANSFIRDLVDKDLLQVNKESLSLHSFQHDYLLLDNSEIEKLHAHLLAAYRRLCGQHGWLSGPNDGYFFQYLCMHLHHANRLNELKLLLLDFDWMEKKLNATSIYSLLSDYEWLEDDILEFVKNALSEAASVLNADKNDLATQLLDRLWEIKELKNNKDIQALLNQAKELAPNWQWQPRFPDEKPKT